MRSFRFSLGYLELSYEDVKSAKNGLIVITPDFDNFTTKLIAADEYSKYMTETSILEGVANREYYGRSAPYGPQAPFSC